MVFVGVVRRLWGLISRRVRIRIFAAVSGDSFWNPKPHVQRKNMNKIYGPQTAEFALFWSIWGEIFRPDFWSYFCLVCGGWGLLAYFAAVSLRLRCSDNWGSAPCQSEQTSRLLVHPDLLALLGWILFATMTTPAASPYIGQGQQAMGGHLKPVTKKPVSRIFCLLFSLRSCWSSSVNFLLLQGSSGNFAGIFRTHKRGSKVSGKFSERFFLRKKFVTQKQDFVPTSLCKRVTILFWCPYFLYSLLFPCFGVCGISSDTCLFGWEGPSAFSTFLGSNGWFFENPTDRL